MIFTRLLKPSFTSTLFILFITLQTTACNTEDLTPAVKGVNEAETATIITDSTTEPVSEPVVESTAAMYSYNSNLSDAQPLNGALLEQTTVYMFFNSTSQYSSMNFYCCKGIDGASTGEAHNTPVRDSSAPFVYSVDLSQFSTAGTRELYVDATRTDGTGLDNFHANFSINITTIPTELNLSWVAPSEREDNTALSLSEIAGYKIQYGTSPGQYSKTIDINDGSAVAHTIKSLPAGTYYLIIRTYDTGGRESQGTAEVTISI